MSETKSISVSEQPKIVLSPLCREILCEHVLRAAELPGIMVEVGAFQGGSAWLMGTTAPQAEIHVIDTFEGLPAPTEGDAGTDLRATYFSSTSYEKVTEALKPLENVHVHKMVFPDGITELFGPGTIFSLVHLDTDLYAPTLAGLRYFAPRLHNDGVILCHDINFTRTPGVDRAITVAMKELPLEMVTAGGYGIFTLKQ